MRDGSTRASRPSRRAAGPRPSSRARAVLAALLALLTLPSAAARAAQLWFPGQISVPVTSACDAIVCEDIEGDGHVELIVGQEDGWVNVLHQLPGGQYASLASVEIGGRVEELGILPPGPSGLPELIALTVNPDRAVLLRWTGGKLPLEPYAALDLDEDPQGLAVGLQDEGGLRRCAVTLPGIDTWVLIGETPAGWAVLQQIPSGDRPVAVAPIDLDRDATPEVVTADNGVLSRGLSIFRRGGDGSYTLSGQLAAVGAPSSLYAFDDDHDGVAELFVAYADSACVSRYEPSGGTLVPAGRIDTPVPGSALHLADLTPDEAGLWSLSAERGTVSYFHDTGAGWSYVESYFAGGRAIDAQMTDLNQDRWPDFAVANGSSLNLGLLYGNNLRRFRGYLVTPLPAQPLNAQLRDENGDGKLDYLVSCFGSRTVEILHGDGRGHLLPDVPPLPFDEGPLGLASLRADADTLADLAVTLPALDRVALRRRLPDGAYARLPDVLVGNYPTDVIAGDMDRDGVDDLVVANIFSHSISVAYGAGDGTFPDVRSISLGVGIQNMILVDLDRDGLPDIVADDGVSQLYTLRNLGGRVFQPPEFYLLADQPASLAAADLDGDGDSDLVVSRAGSQSLAVYENLGSGWLGLRIAVLPIGGRPGSLRIADVDLDGRNDVIAALVDRQQVAILINRGAWQFTPPIRFVTALSPGALGVGDLNGDQVPDFVLLDQALDLTVTMLNVEPNPVPVTPAALAAACVDGALELTIRPPANGGWRLEAVAAGGWTLLATPAGARYGELRAGPDEARLRLDDAARAAAGLTAGAEQLTFRLMDGAGEAALAVVTAAGSCGAETAAGLDLLPPMPNPCNPSATARFRLGRAARVAAAVVDAAGRRVADLGDRWYAAGEHALAWDGRGGAGPAASGVYLIVVRAEGRAVAQRVTLVR